MVEYLNIILCRFNLVLLIVIVILLAIMTLLTEETSSLMLWSGSFLRGCLMSLAETTAELAWKLVIALLANRLQIDLVKLGLLIHLLIANGTGEVVDTPGFVQCSKY